MHYSRIMPLVNGHRYHSSTSVLLNEIIKLSISATVALYEIYTNLAPGTPATALVQELISTVFTGESWKLAVPAALYTLQNTLQYVAVSNLDAATFQVTYQLKILTTAIFSVMLLSRVLSLKRWASLGLLIIGVSIVQMPQQAPSPPPELTTEDLTGTAPGEIARRVVRSLIAKRADVDLDHPEMNRSVGLIAVLISCALSGLAGVLFEKILKQSAAAGTKPVSLWIRNCQLSFWSLFPALFLGVIWVDGANIAKDGFFAGYNWVVWTAIGFQAAGGIIVALVIKYADNIAKNFATSISIIVSALASAYFFDFVITVSVSQIQCPPFSPFTNWCNLVYWWHGGRNGGDVSLQLTRACATLAFDGCRLECGGQNISRCRASGNES
jgi:drug/metabolite transporter (DMT)-like permease